MDWQPGLQRGREERQRENSWDCPSCDNSGDVLCVFTLGASSFLINKPGVLRKHSGGTTQVSSAHGWLQIHVLHPESPSDISSKVWEKHTGRHVGRAGISWLFLSREAESKSYSEREEGDCNKLKTAKGDETKVWLKTFCVHHFCGPLH